MLLNMSENISLAPYTSFKVGGNARWFGDPESLDEFKAQLEWARKNNIPVYVFGKGSNLVFSDSGFNGLVVHTGSLVGVSWHGSTVICEAGVLMYTVMKQSVQKGFQGIQKLGGIPGTLGGCTYINAGAYGQETSDVVVKVVSITEKGDVVQRSGQECQFSYRRSLFCDLQETILSVEMELSEAPSKEDVNKEMRDSLAHRKQTQPLNLPNSGSIFKRPQGLFPGQVIEEAGLKGLSIGGAEVSLKHANFIVNNGEATGQQIYDLSLCVIEKVKAHSGVELEHEVRFVGDFLPWPR